MSISHLSLSEINATSNNEAVAERRQVKRIIIAGGGTGGHIFPAIAIANALKEIDPSIEILFVGAKGKMEMEKVPQAGFNIKGITISGFSRSSLIKNWSLPFKLVISYFEVKEILNAFKPNAIIGVGGYSTYPVLTAGNRNGIPTYIHESNSFAGKSNVLLGKKATKIFVAGEGMERFFPKEKILITGNPVRSSIAYSTITKKEALDFFGLKEGKQTILIVGGSLGAKSINEAITASLNRIGEAGLQIIWQTGKTNANQYKEAAKGKDFVWINEFITQMEMAYTAADIVISRSGAMAVTELCVVGKPSIFVPYPYAAEDHQTANAMALVEKDAALIVKDSDVNETLVSTVIHLSKDIVRMLELKKHIRLLGRTDADKVIAKEVLGYK